MKFEDYLTRFSGANLATNAFVGDDAAPKVVSQPAPAVPTDPRFMLDRADAYFVDHVQNTWAGSHPLRGRSPGPNSIQMRTNDYLCLAGHPHVVEAEVATLRGEGHGALVSRVWQYHERDSLRRFEERVAALTQAEDAVLCSSGYVANTGLMQSITNEATPAYLDMRAHISLWEGASNARAPVHPFRHNDPDHLSKLIEKHGPGVIVVDAVYSIDGDVAPLEAMADVAEHYDCVLVVDETHSFGAHGRDGGGLCVARGLAHRVHFRTIGLSKAAASRGGIVVCSARNAEYLRHAAHAVVFSTTVLQHEVAGYNAVLDIFAEEPWRQEKLHDNHRYLKAALEDIGYNLSDSRTQILAIEGGDVLQTIRLRDAMEVRGLFGSIFFPPATPEKRCIMRFTLNCGLSRHDLDSAVDVMQDIWHDMDAANWPATRRLHRVARRTRANNAEHMVNPMPANIG